jgi:hypothetical protein
MDRIRTVYGDNICKMFDLMHKAHMPSIQLSHCLDSDQFESGDMIPLVTFSFGVAT